MADSITSAWKGALRGVRQGYQMTKTALSLDAGTRRSRSSAHGDVRRRFQAKYGGGVDGSGSMPSFGHDGDGAQPAAAAEEVASDSSEDLPLTDEQLREQIEAKFFDKNYDATRYELGRMTATYADSPEALAAERAAHEQHISEHRSQCDVVSHTLKRRVLEHQQAFVSGVAEVQAINDALLQTSSDCKRGRHAIRRAKAAAATHLQLLALHRRHAQAAEALRLMEAMERLWSKRHRLVALISSGKMTEARIMLLNEGEIEMEEQLRGIFGMRTVLEEWRLYRDHADRLRQCIDVVLTNCFNVHFLPSTYRNACESSVAFEVVDDTCNLVATLLWSTAAQTLAKALAEVSNEKAKDASLADLAGGIHPDHVLLTVCQIAAKLLDVEYLFVTVRRLHADECIAPSTNATASRNGDRSPTSPASPTFGSSFHARALRRMDDIGPRIGRDLAEKISATLASLRIERMDLDRVLHLFVLVRLLLDSFTCLGLPAHEIAQMQNAMEAHVLHPWIARSFQAAKAQSLMEFMAEDGWVPSPVRAADLNVVAPLTSGFYESTLRDVMSYLPHDDDDDDDEGFGREGESGTDNTNAEAAAPPASSSILGAPTADNPFYREELFAPQDTSAWLQTTTFAEYWAAQKHAHKEPRPGEASRLVQVVAQPPVLLTSSALFAANTMLEYVARLVVRYPKVAASVLRWSYELTCLFMYAVADNFVSVSRAVRVEDQGHFSPTTQRIVAEARVEGERAAHAASASTANTAAAASTSSAAASSASHGHDEGGHNNNNYPPRVFGAIREAFTSSAQLYALPNRAVACQSVTTLVFFYEAAITALAPMLPASVVKEHYTRSRLLHEASIDLLHVCLHRLAQAIVPMENICHEIGKLRAPKEEVVPSAYPGQMIAALKVIVGQGRVMPTEELEDLFIKHLVFVAQGILVREYARLSKKLTDMLVMQMQVDAQTFVQQAVQAFGKARVVLPTHALSFAKAGFFAQDHGQLLQWVREHHINYTTADMLTWIAAGDRAFRSQVEEVLQDELHHHDVLPIRAFLATSASSP